MWAPVVHLEPRLHGFTSTVEATEWACGSAEGLAGIRYLREILEAIIRLKAADQCSYLGTSELSILSKFVCQTADEIFASLTRVNVYIAGFGLDDWMLPPEFVSEAPWRPTANLKKLIANSVSAANFADTLAPPDLRKGKEVLTMATKVKTSDQRANFLSDGEHHQIAKFVNESPAQLIEALSVVNARIQETGLDKRVDVSAIVLASVLRGNSS